MNPAPICHRENIKILFNTPTAVLSYCQGIPGCVPWGMIYTFLNDYFSDARGLSVSQATLTLTIFGVGGLVGQFYGGSWGQRLYNQSPKLQCVLMGGSTILGILPMLYLLNTTDYNPGGFYFMALIAGLLVSITGPNVRAVLQVSNLNSIFGQQQPCPPVCSYAACYLVLHPSPHS